jgi:hypothetical protein
MPGAGFEPMITESERAKTVHALDHSATVTGSQFLYYYYVNHLRFINVTYIGSVLGIVFVL